MRLFGYKLLTQLIIWLGLVRERLIARAWMQKRADRVFDVFEFERWSCCDCGMVHHFRAFSFGEVCNHKPDPSGLNAIGHCWPERPKGYDYTFRKGAGKPSLAQPKES